MPVVLSESDILGSSLMEEIHRSWKTTSYVFGLNAVMIPAKVYAQTEPSFYAVSLYCTVWSMHPLDTITFEINTLLCF